MGCTFTCDGCGKQVPAVRSRLHGWTKPGRWYQRTDAKTGQTHDACSRECIDRLERTEGISSLVLPV